MLFLLGNYTSKAYCSFSGDGDLHHYWFTCVPIIWAYFRSNRCSNWRFNCSHIFLGLEDFRDAMETNLRGVTFSTSRPYKIKKSTPNFRGLAWFGSGFHTALKVKYSMRKRNSVRIAMDRRAFSRLFGYSLAPPLRLPRTPRGRGHPTSSRITDVDHLRQPRYSCGYVHERRPSGRMVAYPAPTPQVQDVFPSWGRSTQHFITTAVGR
ncbi:hypothetical protein TNCV_203741 [Trichonephila clavipes]|nr:hypothetical protein TNCV_203741 [Trichonephila clavipes]